jgi:hypothetical protein
LSEFKPDDGSMMRTMDRRRAGAIGLAAAAVVGACVVVLVGLLAPAADPRPSGSPAGPLVGPVVYYELLDAEGSSLMERRLDGQSMPRRVAQRTDVDYGRTWTVDPAGRLAIALVPGAIDQELIAVTIADGGTVWQVRTPTAPIDAAVWSAGGDRFAVSTVGGENDAREAIVVEAASGHFVRGPIPEDAVLQGFDRDGALILRQRLPEDQGPTARWRFLRFDPRTAIVEQLIATPDVGPASNWSDDVHPGAGVAVETAQSGDEGGSVLRLWRLAGGASRDLASFASIDRIALDPAGTGVAVSVAETIRFVALDGRARDLYSSADSIADFGWSATGDYLAVATDRLGANLTVVEGATGRTVLLPQPDKVAQSLFVRIVGGLPLPADPLPPDEPGPTPTPGPSGPDVAAFRGVLSAWTDRTATDSELLHLERLVPTEAGGLRVAATMPLVDLGLGDGGAASLTVLPRPASSDVLVWVQTASGSRGWLWDGAASRAPLALPADWPLDVYDVAWSPDGLSLAGSAGRTNANGDIEGVFVVAGIGAEATTVIPVLGAYDRFEGWWSPSELRVGHGICTEGCEGTFAWSARLRISDGRIVQMTPADRVVQPIDTVSGGDSIHLSMTNDDPSTDVTIEFPDRPAPDSIDPIGFGADGRSFLIAVRTADGTDIRSIADPIGRAIDGRLRDPEPTLIGQLAGRGLRADVSPDEAWAIATDRVENVRLTRLADGRSWAVDRERILVWP